MHSKSVARGLFLSFAILNFLIVPVWADEGRQYDVPQGILAKALINFAKQADISIAIPHLSFRDGKANTVRGRFTLKEGLVLLLRGTGFSFRILSPTAVKVMRIPRHRHNSATPDKSTSLLPPVMEEIRVSGIQRTDFADKLPYGLSVTTGTTLERLFSGLDNKSMFQMMGLSATNQGEGRDKLIIRGLSDGAFSGRTQALVSTYLDYTRMNYNAPDPAIKLVDMASVEVLRGPQGTLYGSGSLGGIYRLVTNKPAFDRLAGKITTTYKLTEDGAPSREVTAMLNIPLIDDRLAIRGVAYYENGGGYIDDIRLHLDNINSHKLYGGRFSSRLNLRDWLHLTTGITFQHFNADDANYYNAALGSLKRNNYTREPHKDVLKEPFLTLEADLSWADLVSSISLLNRDLDNYYDGSFAVPKLTSLALTPSVFEDDRHITAISNETHVNSKEGEFIEWLAGLFLSHRHEDIATNLITPASAALANFGPKNILFTEKLAENLDEIAVFGELTYFLTSRLALTGGLRWFHYANSAVSEVQDIGIGINREATGEQQKSGVIPKFTLSFHADETQLYYLQIAESYRLGGINLKGPSLLDPNNDEKGQDSARIALTTFNPDSLLSVELGFKQKFSDGRIHFRGALFFTDWKNIQSDQFDAIGLPVIGNIGNGQVFGAEIEMAFRPVPALQFHSNITWNSSDITKINTQFGRTIGAAKDGALPGAPTFTVALSGQYHFSLGPIVNVMIDIDYTYVSASKLLFNAGSSRQSDAYHLGNARIEVSRGVWRATLFADNLFNSAANSFAFGNPFSLNEINQITPLRPRTYGLHLSWSY